MSQSQRHFDPTCYLSLPLPVKKERQVEVFLVYLDPLKPPTQFKVTAPKNGSMGDLCIALGKLASVPGECLVVTDVYNHRFHKIYTDEDQLSHILDRDDIFVYETDKTDTNNVTVPVYLREKKNCSSYAPSNLFGQPLLCSLPQSCTSSQLYDHLLQRMARYVSRPDQEVEWWKSPPKSPDRGNGDDCSMEQGEGSSGGSSEESPTSETEPGKANAAVETPDDDMLREEEAITLNSKNYLSMDWHPRAKQKFFNEKAAEDFSQDDSWHGKTTPKKQVIKLSECLKLYTSQEKLG